MSDYDSSLPVRSENNDDIKVQLADGTTPSQLVKVNADGSLDVNTSLPAGTKVEITDGTDDLEINADGSINVKQDKLAFATDSADVSGSSVSVSNEVNIEDLDATKDNVAISDGTNTAAVNASNQLLVKDDNLVFADDKVDASGSAVTVTNELNIEDLDASKDSVEAHLLDETGTAYSPTNPLAVAITGDQPGDEIVDYKTTSAVAANASIDHDYTVSALKTFLGEELWVSGSGKLKVEVLINAVPKFVGFNSTSNPNIRIPLEKMVKANAAEVIKLTITNRDKQPQDLYSTLIGLEV